MKCHKCGKNMKYKKGIPFNGEYIDGFVCACGEIYFDPEQIERVLVANKLRKQKMKAKLGRNRSNLILRLPKDVEAVLGLKQGEEVELSVHDKELRVRVA
ncbi:MAG: AbrB/MazE/SpoVT family DNA-binding domain-containing protein [Candidatus Woesearchaeota archaeon]